MMLDLKDFFNKVNFEPTTFIVRHKGHHRLLSSDTIIAHMLSTTENERCKIAGTLFSLHVRGAPILDYIKEYGKSILEKNAVNTINE